MHTQNVQWLGYGNLQEYGQNPPDCSAHRHLGFPMNIALPPVLPNALQPAVV